MLEPISELLQEDHGYPATSLPLADVVKNLKFKTDGNFDLNNARWPCDGGLSELHAAGEDLCKTFCTSPTALATINEVGCPQFKDLQALMEQQTWGIPINRMAQVQFFLGPMHITRKWLPLHCPYIPLKTASTTPAPAHAVLQLSQVGKAVRLLTHAGKVCGPLNQPEEAVNTGLTHELLIQDAELEAQNGRLDAFFDQMERLVRLLEDLEKDARPVYSTKRYSTSNGSRVAQLAN